MCVNMYVYTPIAILHPPFETVLILQLDSMVCNWSHCQSLSTVNSFDVVSTGCTVEFCPCSIRKKNMLHAPSNHDTTIEFTITFAKTYLSNVLCTNNKIPLYICICFVYSCTIDALYAIYQILPSVRLRTRPNFDKALPRTGPHSAELRKLHLEELQRGAKLVQLCRGEFDGLWEINLQYSISMYIV